LSHTHTLGVRLRRRESLNAALVWRSCVHELPILEGALIPVLALLVAWAAGVGVADAVSAALWVTVASIVVLKWLPRGAHEDEGSSFRRAPAPRWGSRSSR
jgi:hypothetical protein